MKEEEQNKPASSPENSLPDQDDPSAKRSAMISRKTIHHINPLGMRVLVRIRPEQNVTDGGLYLPEGAKESMLESVIGEVVEVASAVDEHTDEETNVSGIPLGASVLIPKKVGVRVPWDEQLRIVETKDVLAIVETIDLS